jgi:hypothetical protein
MPVVDRYLLLPLVLLIVLAAGVAAEARVRPVAPPALAGAAVALLLAGSAPSRLGAVLTRRDDLAAQATLRADLRALAERGAVPRSCSAVVASNHKLVPLLALWTGRAPASFVASPATPPGAEAYVEPATAASRRLVLASRGPPEAAPSPPADAVDVARNRTWRVAARC